MTDTFTLASDRHRHDVQTFLQRAQRLGCDITRVNIVDQLLVLTVCVLDKDGLLDAQPFVYGMRATPVLEGDPIDLLVDTRALLDRFARDSATVAGPSARARVAWAGVTPPREGWASQGELPAARVVSIAQQGIDEVAQANGRGAIIVSEVRRAVWSRNEGGFVSGAAFALYGLGFVVDERDPPVRVSTNGVWMRASTSRGEVLVKS